MKRKDKKEWIINYARKNGIEEILNENIRNKKTNFFKRHSSEIQAFCSLISVFIIGVVSIILTIKGTKIANRQLEVSKYEVKPSVTFSYEKEVSNGVDCIKINNYGAVPLEYNIDIITYFNIMSNETMGKDTPIRIYTINCGYSYNKIENDFQSMAEINVYNDNSDFVKTINDGISNITGEYTKLFWYAAHTYVIRVRCVDVLNETSQFYYMYNILGGCIISADVWESIFNECYAKIQISEGSYTGKEYFFDLKDTNVEDMFRYILKKIRQANLYTHDAHTNEVVLYDDYEP